MKARIKIIPGGSSAGKTYSIIPILIDKAIKIPGLRVSIVSQSLPHLKRGAMRDFLAIMKITGRYRDAHWNRTNFIYTFQNESYIEFFGVEDDDKLRGARRDVLYINECDKVVEDVYTQLAMRTEMDIYLDYNPSHRFWAANITDECERLILTYKDNEALSQTVINFLENKLILAETSDYWKNWCNVYLYGLEGTLEGVVFNNWSIIDYIPSEAKLLGYGMDFGFTNDPSVCIGLYKYDGRIIIDEIFHKKGFSNGDIANYLKYNIDTNYEIYADCAEPKSIAEIAKYGLKILPTKKGADSINAGIQLMQEQPMLITKRSNNLKYELENYSWKKNIDGQYLNIPTGTDHCIDSIRYISIIKLSKTQEYTPLVFM